MTFRVLPYLLLPLLGGCSLIDGLAGPLPDVGEIDLAAPQPDMDFPNDEARCAWVDCECFFDGCNPRNDCRATGCAYCLSDVECAVGDFCNPQFGLCNICTTYLLQHTFDRFDCSSSSSECFYYDSVHDIATSNACYSPPQ